MKSVRTQILIVMCGLVALSLLTLGIVSIYLNQRTTSGVLEQTMKETAKIAAERVSNQINVYLAIVKNVGLSHEIANPDISTEKKQDIIDEIIAEFPELTRGNILDADGISVFSGDSYSDREYFQKAITGQAWISEPLISRVTGAVSLIVAAPIWENGIPNSKTIGVVYFVPAETFLNDIVRTIQISPGAGAQIINKKGTVIAHRDMSFVENENNNQEGEKTDAKLKKIASLEREMMKGNVGFGSYSMLGVDKFLAYAPIPNSDGWSIGVNAPISDFMSYTNTSIIYTVIFLILFLVVSIICALNMANNIGTPLKYLSNILTNMTRTGKVELDAEYIQKENELMAKKNEIGKIAIAIVGILSMLKSNSEVFDLIAGGDLSIDITPRSNEDTLGNSMVKMTSSLNTMFSDINRATEQVSTGSRQIAEGAQTLAQGATEQASTIEQLSSSMSELSDKTKENADMASRAANLANTIKENAERGSNQMSDMISAVKDISHASQSINKVIKVIDDIAFQTNILALNAAVEAARAGQHGKGFAVVAEEVRNLATKSAEAAKSTGELIAGSIEKADLGVKIADETAESLEEIVSGINESSQIVGDIAKSSEQQAFGISEINKGIEQVALVVQQNSATAEESAAASEEMSSQALMLEELITQFKLKDDKTYKNSSSNSRVSNTHNNLENDFYALSDNSDDFGKY